MSLSRPAQKVGLFTILSFLALGIPRVVTTAAATALFLQTFGAEMLPLTYIVAAFLAPTINAVYLWLQTRVSFWSLLLLALGLDALVLAISWIGIGGIYGSFFVLLAMVWVEVEWMLVDLVFWGLAGRMFTIREVKSVLGRIGSGEPAAVILGGLSIPLLLTVFNTSDLFLVSSASILLASAVILALKMGHAGDLQPAEEEQEGSGNGSSKEKGWFEKFLSFGKHSHFVHLIFATTFLTQIIHFVIDTAFCSASEMAYPKEEDLASFLALFMALTGLVNLLFNLVLSEQVMRRFGVGAGLLSLPVLNGMIAALAILSGQLPSEIGIFFIAVSTLKLVDEALRSGLYMPAMQTVFQPLPPAARTRAHAMNGGYMEQIAGGLGGLALLGLTGGLGWGAGGLLPVALLLILGWIAMNRRLALQYIETLGDAFRRRRISPGLILNDPEVARKFALRSLETDRAGEAIYGLHLLEELGDRDDLLKGVEKLAFHTSAQGRKAAIETIGRLRLKEARFVVLTALEKESDPGVRAEILKALAALDGEDSIDTLETYLGNRNREIRVAAYAGLMLHCGIEGTLTCGARFLKLHHSRKRDQKWIAAKILDAIASPQTYRMLMENLKHGDSRIRRLAFRTAAKLDTPELWPLLLFAVASPTDGTMAASALVPAGEKVIPEVLATLESNQSRGTRNRLIWLIGQIGSPQAISWLLEHAASGSLDERWRVARSLNASGYRCNPEGLESAWNLALDAVSGIAFLDTFSFSKHDPISRAMQTWLSQARTFQLRRLFWILASILPRELVLQTARKLEMGTTEEKEYALEMIDSMIPIKYKSSLLSVLETNQAPEHDDSNEHDTLFRLVENKGELFGPAIQAAALLVVHRSGQTPDRGLLERLEEKSDFCLTETVHHVQTRPRKKREKRNTPMLAIEKMILLSSIPTFSELPESLLGDLVAVMDESEVASGDWMIREGEAGDRLYVIVEGQVSVLRGERIVTELGPGDVVGEMAALDPEIRSASVRAKTAVIALSLDHDNLEDLMAGSVELAQGFLRMLTRRLRENIQRQ